MKLNLTTQAYTLLKYVLSFTGEKEVNQKDEEVLSARKLNSEESSQRRHFFANTKELFSDYEQKVAELRNEYNKQLEKKKTELKEKIKKAKEETNDDYNTKINDLAIKDKDLIVLVKVINDDVGKLNQERTSVEITNKTLDVLKKYFLEYGTNIGWGVGDDELVDEIEEQLKLN